MTGPRPAHLGPLPYLTNYNGETGTYPTLADDPFETHASVAVAGGFGTFIASDALQPTPITALMPTLVAWPGYVPPDPVYAYYYRDDAGVWRDTVSGEPWNGVK